MDIAATDDMELCPEPIENDAQKTTDAVVTDNTVNTEIVEIFPEESPHQNSDIDKKQTEQIEQTESSSEWSWLRCACCYIPKLVGQLTNLFCISAVCGDGEHLFAFVGIVASHILIKAVYFYPRHWADWIVMLA